MLHLMSRRSFLLATVGGFALLALPGCESFAGNAVVIYSCAEGVRNESLLTALRSRFPSYDIRLRYVPTGNCAAKLKWRDPDPRPISCSTLRAGTSSKSPISWRIYLDLTLPDIALIFWIPTAGTFLLPERVPASQ